ncbi:hypothetical protein [Bradyrhizobium centrosematis]|uniref:hypothetical protein n=1 Tax=Bradyrhizobium centrosematis TaxID=1300039 RepID=UPI00216931E4|nr:hypothetical protein [Bradyrhizobium centrosematis]MCS3764197.1 hypothetical protein [Bradyrhizobium centrosematis]MCS3776751.1 hypothetical protein [Bradyrhizobium centrosematis]
MSYWDVWKQNFISLYERLNASLQSTTGILTSNPLAVLILIAVVAAGSIEAYRHRLKLTSLLENGKDGKIIVNSPTVYTRQRLVNDRLDQARWLRKQLDYTELDKRESEFRSIDAIHKVASEQRATISGGVSRSPSTDDVSKKEDANSKKDQPDIAVESTTMSQFRAKNAYREEVRSEITQTELDDRHDIKGNTIFRLTFDTSIVASTKRGSVAAIVVRLSHDPEHEQATWIKNLYEKDYQDLFEEWATKFQDNISSSMEKVAQSIDSAFPDQRLRLLFNDFLLRRVCQFARGDVDLRKGPLPCRAGDREKAEELLASYTARRLALLRDTKDKIFWESLTNLRDNPSLIFPNVSRESFIASAANICVNSNGANSIEIWRLGIKPAQQMQTAGGSQQSSGAQDASSPNPSGVSLNSGSNLSLTQIGCPFSDSLRERLVSGVMLYEKLFAIVSLKKQDKQDEQSGQKQGEQTDYGNLARLVAGDLLDCNVIEDCFVTPRRLRCFSADFLKSKLDEFANPSARRLRRIGSFLTLRVVGRETVDCNLAVSPFPKEFEAEASPALLASNPPYLQAFVEALNEGTDAFAYSVTPKNLSENISTSAETRDAYELLMRAEGKGVDFANFLNKRSRDYRAIVSHPIVVGFGASDYSSATTRGSSIRDVDFGWIVAGRMTEDDTFEQIDGQYPLSAFISVPGWWQTVKVSIATCWLSRSDVSELAPILSAKNICPGIEAANDNIPVRLPAAVPEISHKLGFDVVRQPSIFNPKQQELIVGQAGALLIEGQRLWRSTEVTAGAQRADKITILPNMEGILAEFECVLPPSGDREVLTRQSVDADQTVTNDLVRVWTSEGVAEPLPVRFIWPTKVAGKHQKVACDQRSSDQPGKSKSKTDLPSGAGVAPGAPPS